MVTLEQVEQLDQKVKKAVSLIDALRTENGRLNDENSRMKDEIDNLNNELNISRQSADSLANTQELLEMGIMEAIDQLEALERETNDNYKDQNQANGIVNALQNDLNNSEEGHHNEHTDNHAY